MQSSLSVLMPSIKFVCEGPHGPKISLGAAAPLSPLGTTTPGVTIRLRQASARSHPTWTASPPVVSFTRTVTIAERHKVDM